MIDQGKETVGGVLVLRWRISLPQIRQVGDFYDTVGREAAAFCRRGLAERARAAYEADPDPKKRFRFVPFRYELTGRVTHQDEALISVALRVRLQGGGEAPTERHMGQVFDAVDGALLSPDMVARRMGEKRLPGRIRRSPGGVVIEGGKLRQIL